MKRFFNVNNPVFQAIGRIGDFTALSLLWLITSLPIITAGASTTALVAVSSAIVCKNDPSVFRDFFREFRRAFRKSLGVWMAALLAGAVLSVDIYFWVNASGNTLGLIMAAGSIGIALVFAMALLHVFPIMAMFDGIGFRQTVVGAAMVSAKSFFGSLSMLASIALIAWLCLTFPIFLYVFILVGPGLTAWVFGFRFVRTLNRYTVLVDGGRMRGEYVGGDVLSEERAEEKTEE